jgi:hypothetical protein
MVVGCSVESGGSPGIDDELHVAIEEVEKAHQLTKALPRIGWIEQPIELGHRGAETTRELATAEPGPTHPPAGLPPPSPTPQ